MVKCFSKTYSEAQNEVGKGGEVRKQDRDEGDYFVGRKRKF